MTTQGLQLVAAAASAGAAAYVVWRELPQRQCGVLVRQLRRRHVHRRRGRLVDTPAVVRAAVHRHTAQHRRANPPLPAKNRLCHDSRFGICSIALDEIRLSNATFLPVCCSLMGDVRGRAHVVAHVVSPEPCGLYIRRMQVLSGTRTVAVGDGDVVVRTDDAGSTWQASFPPYGMHLLAVFFVDAQTGWAVGAPSTVGGSSASDSTTVLRTDDGGASWRRQVSAPLLLTTATPHEHDACSQRRLRSLTVDSGTCRTC